jgi:hypothetical protein
MSVLEGGHPQATSRCPSLDPVEHSSCCCVVGVTWISSVAPILFGNITDNSSSLSRPPHYCSTAAPTVRKILFPGQIACEAKRAPARRPGFGWISMETQDSFTLSRNGFQESASLLALSKCPSSKSLPTHLKYSQRNDASGNWYTCSFGTHK